MREPTAETFAKDVALHGMMVVLDKDENRHLTFRRPGTNNMHFNITTWPGYLCISGDMGCYVFARLRDMFEFFRGNEISPSYWEEKLQAMERHGGTKEYDPAKFRAHVEEEIKGWLEHTQQAVRDQVLCHADDEHMAREALHNFDGYHDADGYQFHDIWEVDFTEYTYRFIWCCRAIMWAIKWYDKLKVTTKETDTLLEGRSGNLRR